MTDTATAAAQVLAGHFPGYDDDGAIHCGCDAWSSALRWDDAIPAHAAHLGQVLEGAGFLTPDAAFRLATDATNQAIQKANALARAEAAEARVALLVSALQRTERNFRLAVNGRPVRDMAENLAENARALDGDQ